MAVILSRKSGGAGGGGGPPSGPAGGDLTGTYPNPTVGAGKITAAQVAADVATQAELDAVSASIGLVKIANSTLAGAGTFDFTTIAGTYASLQIWMQARATNAGEVNAQLTFNADAGANYYYEELNAHDTSVGAAAVVGQSFIVIGAVPGSSDTAGKGSVHLVTIPNYAGTTFHKGIIVDTFMSNTNTSAGQYRRMFGGSWSNTAAITRITIVPSAGATFVIGSRATLYGLT